ncbi:hypothetical protein [Rosistilla carotiformis]|nr:hypothetical protein [Rosistilla carotiformis]
MSYSNRPTMDEVDQLMLNAQLRDELEPYIDESVSRIDVRRMPLSQENEFLASMLAWERAPAIPISHWFEPALALPHPDELDRDELHDCLWNAIERLHSKRIILECTDHLTDRELYKIIFRDILPCREKKVDLPRNFLHWRCFDDGDNDTWLRFYATPNERWQWEQETGLTAPLAENPPYPRHMPTRPPQEG